jgi:hypothetical protein
MLSLMSSPLLWAQAAAPVRPSQLTILLRWVSVFGDPTFTVDGVWGGPLTWLKVIAIIAFVCWLGNWTLAGLRRQARGVSVPVITLAAAIVVGLVGVAIGTLAATGRASMVPVAGQPLPIVLGLAAVALFVLFLESVLWPTILRQGTWLDLLTLVAVHLGLALGLAVASALVPDAPRLAIVDMGARLGTTYMGFCVLAGVAWRLAGELVRVRPRRLRALAWHNILESNRRMWAPWVVLTLFVVVLAFTHWFLAPPPAELGRMYVGTLMLFISLVLTAMVVILTPLSLPTDIRQHTIYTVVTKPVRRIELVWGRIIGFMTLVTVLLGIFGVVSGLYIKRQVDRQIEETKADLRKARTADQRERVRSLEDTLAQLEARRSARVPLKGSLMFEDSVGKKTPKGVDVGQELETRSFVEGATPSRAIWRYGRVMDPFDELLPDPNRTPLPELDRRLPVDQLLKANTIEWFDNQAAELAYEKFELEQRRRAGQLSVNESQRATTRSTQLDQEIANNKGRADTLRAQERDLREQARKLEADGNAPAAAELRQRAVELHSPKIKLQMTFNVYRTTKGQLGEPVYASIRVIDFLDDNRRFDSEVIPIREYYTNTWEFASSALVGTRGYLRIEVKCISPTQYLGMSESDLYVLADSGNFWVNYAKGLLGVWLQALVLTAVGVFAGTFLSWPVALLLNAFFFLFGQLLYQFLQAIALQSLLGGGPFESFIRMLSHSNQMTDLAPTVPVVIAKTLDSVVMPILSRLVYIIPNLPALDFSEKVADGFAVGWDDVRDKLLLALGYAVPFSIAGYFILKQREVAA